MFLNQVITNGLVTVLPETVSGGSVDIITRIADAFKDGLLSPLKHVTLVVAGLAIIIGGIVWAFNPDPKGVEKAKITVFTAVGALVLVYGAFPFVEWLVGLLSAL